MTVTDELVKNAEIYAARFDKGGLPLPPARKVAVVACMDARLNPYGLLGLQRGRRPRDPQRRRRGHRRRDPFLGHLAAAARHRGDRPRPPHRLRDAHLHRRRVRRAPSRTRSASSPNGRRSRSPTSTRTYDSRSPASRPRPSYRTRSRSAASSTTFVPVLSRRSSSGRSDARLGSPTPAFQRGQPLRRLRRGLQISRRRSASGARVARCKAAPARGSRASCPGSAAAPRVGPPAARTHARRRRGFRVPSGCRGVAARRRQRGRQARGRRGARRRRAARGRNVRKTDAKSGKT